MASFEVTTEALMRRRSVRIWPPTTSNCVAMPRAGQLIPAKAWASRFFSGVG